MTTANYPDNPAAAGLSGDTGSSSTGATDQAKQAAGTAADEGKHVAGVAQGEAKRVVSEAQAQAHGLLDQATSQVDEQSRAQRDRLVSTLQSFGDELEQMAEHGQNGMATDIARQVAERARTMSAHLDGREPRELLDDVRQFARRRPGTFLLGALAAGVVAGRLTRGAKESSNGSSGRSSMTPATGVGQPSYGTAAGDPLAGLDTPTGDPAYPSGTGTTATGTTATGTTATGTTATGTTPTGTTLGESR
jgi:hypothetical protein